MNNAESDLENELVIARQNDTLEGKKTLMLTPLQRGYFVGSHPEFDLHVSPHLYLEFALRDCDVKRLRYAVEQVIHRHPILRARVSSRAELILSDEIPEVRVPIHDLVNAPESENRFVQKIRDQLIRSEFKHDESPGIWVHVSKLQLEYRVHILLNLLLLDATAVRLVLADLSQWYVNGASNLVLWPLDPDVVTAVQNQHRLTERYQWVKKYWFEKLNVLPDIPVLPLKQAVGSAPRRSLLNRRRYVLSAEKWAKMVYFCKKYAISPASALLVFYAASINFWCKYPQFYITVMIQGHERDRLPSRNVASNFAKTLILDFDFSQYDDLETMFVTIKERLFRAMTQSVVCGLEVLQEKNRNDRTTQRVSSPVAFVNMLSEPDYPRRDDVFQLESSHMRYSALETPQVLLDHQAISRPDGGVTLVLDAMDSAFEKSVVDDLFAAYIILLESFMSSGYLWKSRTQDLRNNVQKLRHAQYNDSVCVAYSGCLLHEYLYRAQAKFKNQICVIDAEGSYSYEAVYRRSNQLAHYLRRSYAVKPNDLMAISLPKGWHQIMAVQAVLASGAGYVPIMPSWPIERKKKVLSSCGCRVLLMLSTDQDVRLFENLDVLTLDTYDFSAEPETPLATIQRAQDIAYVVFTSGSTGTPKGVMLNHAGPTNTINDINHRLEIDQNDRLLGVSDLSFDLSVYDIFGCMAAGATLILPAEGQQNDPVNNCRMLKKYDVTVWNSVPALMQMMLDYMALSQILTALPLKRILLSGDWIPVSLPQKIDDYCDATVYSLGGATEASIWSIYYPLRKGQHFSISIPYGYPLANQTIHVLDHALRARPDDVPGEIYIGGAGLAMGYWEDPDKTSAAFIKHPETNAVLYRTGDFGVRRREGYVEFLGREDGQVKVRGFRVELGEIESVLHLHPYVDIAVVSTTGDTPNTQLVAHVTLAESSISEHAIKAVLYKHLEHMLPHYMLPDRIHIMDHFPLTAMGKIDRKALKFCQPSVNPVPSFSVTLSSLSAAHLTRTEQRLAQLWSALLNIPEPSSDADFFDLGGTSFTAVRLMVLIQEHFGVEVPLAALIQYRCLRDLAKKIDALCLRVSSEHTTPVAALNVAVSRSPQFWSHPSGGNVFCYRDIAQQLSPYFHCYGIHARIYQQEADAPVSMESIARTYVQQIKKIQPDGPYHLAGWSFGGTVSFEMARQLCEQGDRVESLILIDSPVYEKTLFFYEYQLMASFFADLCQKESITLACDLKALASERGVALEDVSVESMAQWAYSKNLLPDFSGVPLADLFSVFKRNLMALHHYRPKMLDGVSHVLLLSASQHEEHRVPSHSLERWLSVLPEQKGCRVTCYTLEGDHYSIVGSPMVERLNEWLTTELDLTAVNEPVITSRETVHQDTNSLFVDTITAKNVHETELG